MITRFLNLSAGLAWRGRILEPYGFVRIESTACEQKRWGEILDGLDHSLLAPLALGHMVTVYDCGARKPVSRAIWQGLPWIRYALARRWFDREARAIVRGGCNCTAYFREVFEALPAEVFRRVDYYRGNARGAVDLRGESFAIEGHNPSAADLLRAA